MSSSRDDFDSTDFGSGGLGGPARTLADLCHEAFLLIFHLHGGNEPGHPEELKKDISVLLQDLEKHGKRNGHAEEDIKATRYALCSLIDETILNSQWEFKDQWADRPLQLEHFGEHMAGERFFDLLDRIRKKGARKVDVLEVFCLTLILGFQGKYKLRGQEELAKLIRGIVAEIHSQRGSPASLSPNWQIPDEPVERPAQTIPRWVLIAGIASVLLVILGYFLFDFWLVSDAEEAVRRMVL